MYLLIRVSFRPVFLSLVDMPSLSQEYGLENIEVSMKVNLAEEDLASTVIATLDQFIMDCQYVFTSICDRFFHFC